MTYWPSESRESCHPVKNANRNPSDIGKTKTIKRYWLFLHESRLVHFPNPGLRPLASIGLHLTKSGPGDSPVCPPHKYAAAVDEVDEVDGVDEVDSFSERVWVCTTSTPFWLRPRAALGLGQVAGPPRFTGGQPALRRASKRH